MFSQTNNEEKHPLLKRKIRFFPMTNKNIILQWKKKCVNLLKEHSDIGNKKDFLFLYTTYKNQGFIQYVT